jgi:hypothetical protein
MQAAPLPPEADMRRGEIPAGSRKTARLMYAMLRHTRTWCPHVKAKSPVPVIAQIDAGWIGCFACRASTPLVVDDDPRCRLCDAVPDWYIPVMIAVGPVLYAAEACSACCAEVTGPDDEPAATTR